MFTIRYRRGALINGQRGYEFEIFEAGRLLPIRTGWTAGKKSDAYAEAHRAIRDLEAARASITRCTSCQAPTHASESDDDGRCVTCMRAAGVEPITEAA